MSTKDSTNGLEDSGEEPQTNFRETLREVVEFISENREELALDPDLSLFADLSTPQIQAYGVLAELDEQGQPIGDDKIATRMAELPREAQDELRAILERRENFQATLSATKI